MNIIIPFIIHFITKSYNIEILIFYGTNFSTEQEKSLIYNLQQYRYITIIIRLHT